MTSIFDDPEALEKVAVNMFYGWGYNFYRDENLLRADDLMVRAKVGALLGQSRAAVEAAEGVYRRVHLPPPTREKPRPDPAAVAGAQALEALSHEIGAIEGQIRAQPVPEADKMTNRYRREAETLHRLLQADMGIVGRAEVLRTIVDGQDGEAILAAAADLRRGLQGLERSLRERQGLLWV